MVNGFFVDYIGCFAIEVVVKLELLKPCSCLTHTL